MRRFSGTLVSVILLAVSMQALASTTTRILEARSDFSPFGLKIGMPWAEARSLLSQFHGEFTPPVEGGFGEAEYGGIRYAITVFALEGRVASLKASSRQRQRYEEVLYALTQKYGPPLQDSHFKWKHEDHFLTLSATDDAFTIFLRSKAYEEYIQKTSADQGWRPAGERETE